MQTPACFLYMTHSYLIKIGQAVFISHLSSFLDKLPTNNFPTAARMISPFGGGAVEVTVWNKRFKMDFGNEERR